MNADQRRMMKKKDLEREEAERAKNRQFTLPFNESEQLVRKQIQELLTDYIGKEKEVKKRNSVESCAKELNGHFMLTILRCENLWIHGKLEDAMSTYCWVTYRDKKESNVQGYASSLCLQTRNPVWVDNLRLEFDSLDGHAFLAIFVMSVPGDPHLANLSHLDAAEDAHKAKKAHLHGAVKKTPLEMKLEAMKKAAIKKQKEEMLKLAAQQAADADTGARELSPTEKQWLVLKNYLQLLEQQSNIQLPMPAVPDQHCPVGVLLVNARTMRHAIRTKEPLQIERSLLCGHGRMSIELEFRGPPVPVAQDLTLVSVDTPRGESVDLQVKKERDEGMYEGVLGHKGKKEGEKDEEKSPRRKKSSKSKEGKPGSRSKTSMSRQEQISAQGRRGAMSSQESGRKKGGHDKFDRFAAAGVEMGAG